MALAPGTRLGPYEITGAIGAGGMGEVYRARDTKLGRDVALKVLLEAFAADPERMARFEREAKVLASLNHANIASIYGLEESNGLRALVMELVEGPTLADRIAQGPIPVDEAFPIARQICEGLEYAHERGIVHRDLKPANIKITPEGTVKLLDFGLAKALEGDAATGDPSTSPTLSHLATQAGVILGTAAYMSPEQAKGKAVDRRADIWAFGCVLYEILTGKPAFEGETVSDVLAAVIRAEPDWSALPTESPGKVRELLQRCLTKDLRQRLQAIGDTRIMVEETLSRTAGQGAMAAETDGRAKVRERIAWAATVLLTIVTAGLAYGFLSRPPRTATATISEISPPPKVKFVFSGNFSDPPALSPDGKWLAFGAPPTFGSATSGSQPELWLRAMDSPTARSLAGTNGAIHPFWSPDSRYIGYFADGKLNRIDLSGGPPLALADAPAARGGSWNRTGTILFGGNPGIYRTPASGGKPRAVTRLNASRQEVIHRCPRFLPDGRHFLFFATSLVPENDATYAASIDGGEPKLLLRGNTEAVYAPPGYLLFVRQGKLMGQPFDAKELRLTGDAVPIAEHANVNLAFRSGIFTVSDTGLLSYAAGGSNGADSRLLWFDRNGRQTAETGTPARYVQPSLSPDGRQLAVVIIDPVSQIPNVWVYDIARGIRTRLTFSRDLNAEPAWSPDGKVIAFNSSRGGKLNLYQKAADGTGGTTPLVVDDSSDFYPTWSSNGRYLLYQRTGARNQHVEIWALPLSKERKAFPVIRDKRFNASEPAPSPNGRWLAYVSDESGRQEVYIVPFLHGSGKWLVSTNGGSWPQWRHDGKELFYVSPDKKLVAAQVSGEGASLAIGRVATLFQMNPPSLGRYYDVSAYGKKFLVVTQNAQQATKTLTLVTDWPALLKKQ